MSAVFERELAALAGVRGITGLVYRSDFWETQASPVLWNEVVMSEGNQTDWSSAPRNRKRRNLFSGVVLVGAILFLFMYIVTTGAEEQREEERRQESGRPDNRPTVDWDAANSHHWNPNIAQDSGGMPRTTQPVEIEELIEQQRGAIQERHEVYRQRGAERNQEKMRSLSKEFD